MNHAKWCKECALHHRCAMKANQLWGVAALMVTSQRDRRRTLCMRCDRRHSYARWWERMCGGQAIFTPISAMVPALVAQDSMSIGFWQDVLMSCVILSCSGQALSKLDVERVICHGYTWAAVWEAGPSLSSNVTTHLMHMLEDWWSIGHEHGNWHIVTQFLYS